MLQEHNPQVAYALPFSRFESFENTPPRRVDRNRVQQLELVAERLGQLHKVLVQVGLARSHARQY